MLDPSNICAEAPSFEQSRPFGLGGSDIGAILGLSPYKTPFQLWAEKVSPHIAPLKDAIHLRFGHHVEPFIAQEYERNTGLKTVSYPQTIFHPEHNFMFAHVDRLVEPKHSRGTHDTPFRAQTLLECKTASVFNRDEWGEAGSDQVPAHYLVQCVWYMAITECSRADIAVLLGNQEFRIYKIHRDMALERVVLKRAHAFWFDHVVTKSPPAAVTEADLRTIYPKEVFGKEIEADAYLLDSLKQYKSIQTKIAELNDHSEDLRLSILKRIGEAEQIKSNGKVLATWKTSKPSQRLDTKALCSAYPELSAQFTKQNKPSRRFVVKELA